MVAVYNHSKRRKYKGKTFVCPHNSNVGVQCKRGWISYRRLCLVKIFPQIVASTVTNHLDIS